MRVSRFITYKFIRKKFLTLLWKINAAVINTLNTINTVGVMI